MNPEQQPEVKSKNESLAPGYDNLESKVKKEQHRAELEQVGKKAAELQGEDIERARASIEQQPTSEVKIGNEGHQPTSARVLTTKEKAVVYGQTLKRTRQALPKNSERAFSKFIHQPSIEKVSDIAAKTVMRPSLTLGFSLGAFFGGGIIYAIAKRSGFAISGSEFLLFGLFGGFLGLILELIKNLFKRMTANSAQQ